MEEPPPGVSLSRRETHQPPRFINRGPKKPSNALTTMNSPPDIQNVVVRSTYSNNIDNPKTSVSATISQSY